MPTSTRESSRSYSLAQGILEMISERGLGRGDVLPNAKALADHFDVTTPTIREALRTLEATGAVELRHGSGTYVGENVGRLVLANPNGLDLTDDVLVQMIDTRLVIEPQIAGLAAVQGADLDALEAALESSDLSLTETPQRNFHREMARLAGNVVMYEVVDSLLSVRSREQREIRRMYDRERDHAQHTAIFDAVRTGDAGAAQSLMREHLADIRAAVADETLRDHPDEHRAA